MLAAKIEGGATQYYHQDQLSVRVLTDSNGVKIGEQQATAAAYNLGKGGVSGNPDTIDRGSTWGNYGSDITLLMHCFK